MFAGRGCIVTSAAIGVVLLALLTWHNRLETIESTVSANGTGCSISTGSYGGWRNGVLESPVAYPLKIYVFVHDCPGLPEGRPYSATLVSAQSGKVVASGLSCADSAHAEGYPCRLELPPLDKLAGQDRYRVRVVKTKGQKASTAELQLFIKSEWRSVAYDALLSV